MKRVGVIVFATALILGVIASSLFSFGKISGKIFDFNFKLGSVKGSGNMTTARHDVSGFHGVDVGGVFQVEITAQKEYSLEIEADDNLLEYIRVEERNGILHISSEKKLSTSNPLKVRISAPDIDVLDVSGVSNVVLNNLNNKGISVDSSGASKVRLSGQTAKLAIDVSGATKVDAESLVTENATVDASGASSANVNVTGILKADASGASKIYYSGSPKDLIKKTSGASSVAAR
jgi:hypothetical protein